jgi:hypothetical protein
VSLVIERKETLDAKAAQPKISWFNSEREFLKIIYALRDGSPQARQAGD